MELDRKEALLKVMAKSEKVIEEVFQRLYENYMITYKGNIIQNDRDNGLHCFIKIKNIEEEE